VTTVLNIVLLSLAGFSVLAALYFVAKGLGARSRIHRQAYSVGQVEARRTSHVYWIRAAFLVVVALIFVAAFAIRPLITGGSPEPTPTLPATLAPQQTAAPTTGAAPTTAPAQTTPTGPPPSPTAAATAAPTATITPQTATVSSGVGVWLRGAPGTTGAQLEWLLDGTLVTLLPGQQTADDLLWQQVRTEAGVEGWVAMDFLTINATTP